MHKKECIIKYDKDHTAIMLGDFQRITKPRAAIGEIRPRLRPRITFKIGYIPNTFRRDIPTYWDIYFDTRYIGSFQECFTGITSLFFADEPLRSLQAQRNSLVPISHAFTVSTNITGNSQTAGAITTTPTIRHS